jgi:hypothetical protein
MQIQPRNVTVQGEVGGGGTDIAGLPFSDGFESGNLSAWSVVGGTVTVTTAQAFEGTRCASTSVTSGQQSDNYLEYNFGDALQIGGVPTGMNEIWIRFAHKWDTNYTDTGATNQKLLLLNSHNQVSPGRRRYQLTFNYSQGSSAYFFEFFRWNEDGSFGGNVTPVHVMTGFNRVKGRWEEFVFRIRQNTPGVSDGHLDVWTKVEGESAYTQRVTRTNINYRESSNFTPNRLIGLSNFDTITTRNGLRYWDSIYIGQEAVDLSPDVTDNDGLVVTNFALLDTDAAQIISLDINNTLIEKTSTGAAVTYANETWWSGASVPVATIRPPTTPDGYAGFGDINLWKNAQKVIRQLNWRLEFKVSDLFCANSTGLPKWFLMRTARTQSTGDSFNDRPMLYINHMNEHGSGTIDIADCLVFCPAQGTVRFYASTNVTPAATWADLNESTIAAGPIMRQPFYLRATPGVDGSGNTIVDADEYICVEMRVNVMSTAAEPNGVIGMRIYRRASLGGLVMERACAWTYWPVSGGPQVNTNFIADVDVIGGGYFNLANDGSASRTIKIGRRMTFATNYQPTVGRAWIGPPTGF